MIRYTARNGTTFHFEPDAAECVHVISSDFDGPPVPLDLEDLREFLHYLEERADATSDLPTDADLAAVGPD